MSRGQRPHRLGTYLLAVVALVVLGLVFLLYFQAPLVFDLASRLWSCF